MLVIPLKLIAKLFNQKCKEEQNIRAEISNGCLFILSYNYTNALETITNRMNNTKIVPVEVNNAAAPKPAPPP